MRVGVADQVQLDLRPGTTTNKVMIGGYVDLANFRHARLAVAYGDLVKVGAPVCTIKAYPAWRGDELRGTVIGTVAFSEVNLGGATAGAGLLTDNDRATAARGYPDAPGAVVMVEFSAPSTDTLVATIAVAFTAFP